MSAQIRRKDEKIVIVLSGVLTRLEAVQVCKRVEALLSKTNSAQLVFSYKGKLALEPVNYAIWETLLDCLKDERVKAVFFIFDKENAPYRFLAQEYARRANVPCFQRDSLEQLALN